MSYAIGGPAQQNAWDKLSYPGRLCATCKS